MADRHPQLHGLGRLDLAILSCLDMLERDPDSAFAMVRIADAYHALGDHEEAQAWGRRVHATVPERISRRMAVEDDRAGFVAMYDAWREREEPLPENAFQLADYLCDADRHDDARRVMSHFHPEWYEDETPRIFWNNDWDALRVAFSLLHTGDTARAHALFNKILDYQSGARRDGLQGYGFLDILALEALGRRDEAIAAYEELHRAQVLFGFWRIREGLGPWKDIAYQPGFEPITAAIQRNLDAQLRALREELAFE